MLVHRVTRLIIASPSKSTEPLGLRRMMAIVMNSSMVLKFRYAIQHDVGLELLIELLAQKIDVEREGEGSGKM